MIHPATERRLINNRLGYGVFATAFIPRGTITWVRDELDRVITAEQFARLSRRFRKVVDTYSYIDPEGNYVMCWDNTRFINHSCWPSCRGPGWDFEIAVRDISPGEELTDDYGALNLTGDFACLCGAASCRGVIRDSDFDRFAAQWDRELAEPFRLINSVAQPLWSLLPNPDAVGHAATGAAPVLSCLALRYPRLSSLSVSATHR